MQRLDDQVRQDRDRSDKLIRETDQRSHEQIREVERRADQRVADVKSAADTTYQDLKVRSEERLRDQSEAYKQRIEDMRDNHARELKRKDDELVLMRTGLEGNMGIVLANKETEIKRLERELREAKALAEANKDWVGQMEKAEQQALALGYSKPEPGEGGEGDDLKTIAAKSALGMLSQLPQIIESGASAIAKMRNPGAPPDPSSVQARVGARGHMRTVPRSMGPGAPPVMLAPLPFATEDGGYSGPSDSAPMPQPPRRPVIAPLEQSATQAIVPVSVEQLQPPPQQQHMEPNPPAQQHAAAPEQQQMSAPPAPVAAPSIPPPPNPASASTDLDPMTMSIIQGLTPSLVGSFTHRIDPQAVAAQIVQENGIEAARAALAVITIDQLLVAIGQDATPEHAVLRTRNGQKFLREIWRAAEALVGQPG